MTRQATIDPEFNGGGSNLSFASSSAFEIVPFSNEEGNLGSDLVVYPWLDKNGKVIGYFVVDVDKFADHAPNGEILDEVRYDAIDDLTFTLSGALAPASSTSPFSPTDSTQNYNYLTSRLNGDVNVVIKQGVPDSDVEVGSGGTASVVTGAATTLFVWHPKNVIWNNLGSASDNRPFFEQFDGTLTQAPGELVLATSLTHTPTKFSGGYPPRSWRLDAR
jgi:hypothetical protein